MNTEQTLTARPKDIPQRPIEILSNDAEIMLRQFTPQDSEELFALIDRNRDHLSQFDDETATKYPTLETVRESIEHPKNPNRLRFGMRNKQGELVGTINVTPEEDNPKRGEVGYYLGSEFQKKGYMGRALELLTDYAFSNLGYEILHGDVTEGNNASVGVLTRAGYVETARHDNKIELTKKKSSDRV